MRNAVIAGLAILMLATSDCNTDPRTVATPSNARGRIVALMPKVSEQELTAHEFAADPRARMILEREHALVFSNGRAHFAGAALRESTSCGTTEDGGEERCFHLVRFVLVAVGTTVHRNQSLDAAASDETYFTFRAIPTSPLAKSIAASGRLLCTTDVSTLIPWKGAETLATGDLFASSGAGVAPHDELINGCPQSATFASNF